MMILMKTDVLITNKKSIRSKVYYVKYNRMITSRHFIKINSNREGKVVLNSDWRQSDHPVYTLAICLYCRP